MENQLGPVNRVTCRKCGGSHFTIKCGKEKVVNEPVVEQNIERVHVKESNNGFIPNKKPERSKPYFKQTYRVKISELPIDMTDEEMMRLTCDWGHIVRVKVINYDDNAVAFIDFGYEVEADYFVKALDKTPFEKVNLLVSRVDSSHRSKKF